jgi:hypothetical protein
MDSTFTGSMLVEAGLSAHACQQARHEDYLTFSAFRLGAADRPPVVMLSSTPHIPAPRPELIAGRESRRTRRGLARRLRQLLAHGCPSKGTIDVIDRCL